ncbi:MAG TPA: MarR family transcriptional regulator [Rhodobiaceae bacterium]|nr:MarR family transcriptional regulator [Rhodobiaceae bacterium]
MHSAHTCVNPAIVYFMRYAYISDMDRTTNLLGALALAITDRIEAGMKNTFDRSGESAAAIVVLGYAPGLSVEILRQVLNRSHPGTVRLIDRLEEDGFVERRQAADGRAVALHLTRRGTKLRQRLMDQRLDLLEAGLKGLTASERTALGDLLAKVLTNLPETEMAKHRICRLCAVPTCSDCPIPGHAI